ADENITHQLKSYSFAEQITMLTKVLYEQRVKALVPDNRSIYNKVEARKTIMSLYYIMAGMRN
ncbi:16498_t:CDS:2, partial [Funneliformis caledonium]